MYDVFNINSEEFSTYRLSMSSSWGYNSVQDYFAQNFSISIPNIYSYKIHKSSTVPADEYYLAKKKSIKSGPPPSILPIAVRYVTKHGKYLIERPPFQIEVDFRMGNATSGAPKMHPVKIWIPWTLTTLDTTVISTESLNKTEMYFNDSSLYTLDDEFIPMYLPNAYSNGSICFSNSMNDFHDVMNDPDLTSSVSHIYNYIFSNYMGGGWNCDLSPTMLFYLNSRLDHSSLKYYSEYIDPSTERKKRALDNFRDCDSSMYKAAKNAIFSRVHPSSIRKYHRLYLRHFAILSTFTLEETLGFVSDLKQYSAQMRERNKHSSNLMNIERLFDEKKNNTYYNNNSSSSVSILNSILSNPNISRGYIYTPSSSGMIVMNNPPVIRNAFNRSYRVNSNVSAIPPHILLAIKDIMISTIEQEGSVNIGINYNADDPNSSTIFIIEDIEQYLADNFGSLLSDLSVDSVDANMRRYLDNSKVFSSINKVL